MRIIISTFSRSIAAQQELESFPQAFGGKRKMEESECCFMLGENPNGPSGRPTAGTWPRPGTLLEEDQASQAWRSALRYGLPSSGKR